MRTYHQLNTGRIVYSESCDAVVMLLCRWLRNVSDQP